jgi:hypothetical protein
MTNPFSAIVIPRSVSGAPAGRTSSTVHERFIRPAYAFPTCTEDASEPIRVQVDNDGVMSNSVAQRRRELGIRMALGTERHQLRSMVVTQAMKTTIVDLAIGIGCLRPFLYPLGVVVRRWPVRRHVVHRRADGAWYRGTRGGVASGAEGDCRGSGDRTPRRVTRLALEPRNHADYRLGFPTRIEPSSMTRYDS